MTIRRMPEDFLVRERLSPSARAALRPERGPGAPHAVYELSKTSLATPEAASMLARALGIRAGQVHYAGLKDKHARTMQHVTVPCEADPPGSLRGRGWSARLAGWLEEPIGAEALEGNSFEIVVRGLSPGDSERMEARAGMLRAEENGPGADGRVLIVVNYFGAQRFGSARHGRGFVARRLIEDDFEGALRLAIGTPSRKDTGKTREFARTLAQRWGDWARLAHALPGCPERAAIETLARGGGFRDAYAALPPFLQRMHVEAFQSHLWNAAARGLSAQIAEGCREPIGEDAEEPRRDESGWRNKRPRTLLAAKDEFGPMLFPAACCVDETWRNLVMPVLGRTTVLEEPWGAAAARALADEGVDQRSLRVPGLRRPFFGEAPRPLCAAASRFGLGEPERDELASKAGSLRRVVEFDLPRGAYATVVLRALGQ